MENESVPVKNTVDSNKVWRKALFPTEKDDSDSDLGPISPLSDNSDINHHLDHDKRQKKAVIEDYDIVNESYDDYTSIKSDSLNLNLTILSTPTDYLSCANSPNMMTPHDTSTDNIHLPRITRKSQTDDLPPHTKDSEEKNSKVRTALFPDVQPLSVKLFYSKGEEEKKSEKSSKTVIQRGTKNKNKSAAVFLCSRRKKNKYGQINAGVRHNIKKPKPVKAKKTLKKMINSNGGEHLVEYIKNLSNLKQDNKMKQITPIKYFNSNKNNDDKENQNMSHGSNEQYKKFFKSQAQTNKKEDLSRILTADFEVANIIADFDDEVPAINLNSIIDTLESDIGSTIILKASDKINESNNSVLLHQPTKSFKDRKRKLDDKNIETMLSPTSHMCDMTSGLAINSPKRAKLNINKILEKDEASKRNVFNDTSVASATSENKELYPIFYPENYKTIKEITMDQTPVTRVKKFRKIDANQMLLDAGQKRFGHIQCPECEFIYSAGDPDDELAHSNYHDSVDVLRYNGWKNERLVYLTYDGDKIIKIIPSDPKVWIKKANSLMHVVNRDLGYYDMPIDINKSIIFIYIKNKSIAGCVAAEAKNEAFKMCASVGEIDVCSEETYPIKCGVSKIWVSPKYRKQGIGTALMNCVRKNFCYGYILKLEEIALSSPTVSGKQFATKYFNTPNFLIYMK